MSEFSSGSQRDLYYKEETVYGVVEGGVATGFTEIRNTEDSISLVRDNFVSDERRGDRGIHDMRLGNKQPAGDIGFEFSYEAFDDFLEGALCSDWGATTANVLEKGVVFHSYSVVKAFSDILEYQLYPGGVVNTMSLDINPNAMVTGSFGMIFQDMSNGTGVYVDTPAASTTNTPFDGFTGTIEEGTEAGTTIAVVSSLSLSLDNGFERNFVLMSNKNPQVTWGKSNVTGSMVLYFEDTDEYDKFVNETESGLTITLEDLHTGTSGNKYKIRLPRIKYTSADAPVNSDGSVMITMNFQALDDESVADGGIATNIQITRIVAVA